MTAAFLLNHPQHVEHVLQTNHQNYRSSMPVGRAPAPANRALFLQDTEQPTLQRKLIQPIFRRANLELLGDQILCAAEQHLEQWDSKSRAPDDFNLSKDISEFASRVAIQMFFGARNEEHTKRFHHAMRMIEVAKCDQDLDATMLETRSPPSHSQTNNATIREIHSIVAQIFEERGRDSTQAIDLLGIVLQACDAGADPSFSSVRLQSEVANLFISGFESSASLLTWTVYFLSENPHVMEHVRNEADLILQGRLPTNADLREMDYTKRVIQEAARLRPSVLYFSRTAIEDDVIGGELIKAGTTVLISQAVLHQLPSEWQDPERFDPDRFLPEHAAGRSRFAYLPFGAGPSVSLGSTLTMMELQIILPLIYRQFDVSVTSGASSGLGQPEPLGHQRDLRASIAARVRH